jgi:SOS regulatory protein LexA
MTETQNTTHTGSAAYSKYKKALLSFYKRQKRMPGYAEIMELTGFRSKNAVFKLIAKLVEEGVVQKDVRGRLSPLHLEMGLPLVGHIRAGFASPSEEELADTITIGDYLIRDKDASYLLEVVGDSMIDAGIQEGDMVIFERTHNYRPGDIVIALTEDGYTIKYLRNKGARYYLEAANAAYLPIYPREGEIIGVVTGTFRRYK